MSNYANIFINVTITRYFIVILILTSLKAQCVDIDIDRALFVSLTESKLFLIIKVVENNDPESTFYHIYRLQAVPGVSGGYSGDHLEQLDSVKFINNKRGVRITPFEKHSTLPTEYSLIEEVKPWQCTFR